MCHPPRLSTFNFFEDRRSLVVKHFCFKLYIFILHIKLILILISKLIFHLSQFLKLENRYCFDPYHQPPNITLMWILKYY